MLIAFILVFGTIWLSILSCFVWDYNRQLNEYRRRIFDLELNKNSVIEPKTRSFWFKHHNEKLLEIGEEVKTQSTDIVKY